MGTLEGQAWDLGQVIIGAAWHQEAGALVSAPGRLEGS